MKLNFLYVLIIFSFILTAFLTSPPTIIFAVDRCDDLENKTGEAYYPCSCVTIFSEHCCKEANRGVYSCKDALMPDGRPVAVSYSSPSPNPSTITVGPAECPGSNIDNILLETAIGCIPTTPQGFISKILEIAIFIAGGMAFLLMGWGAFLLITSQGNPEQIKGGQEIIVSAGAGLLFIIFAVFMLRLIGFDILKIPGFQQN